MRFDDISRQALACRHVILRNDQESYSKLIVLILADG